MILQRVSKTIQKKRCMHFNLYVMRNMKWIYERMWHFFAIPWDTSLSTSSRVGQINCKKKSSENCVKHKKTRDFVWYWSFCCCCARFLWYLLRILWLQFLNGSNDITYLRPLKPRHCLKWHIWEPFYINLVQECWGFFFVRSVSFIKLDWRITYGHQQFIWL